MIAPDLVNILVIAAGLILFTYMIWMSRSRNRRLRDTRKRLKDKWRQRLEDHE